MIAGCIPLYLSVELFENNEQILGAAGPDQSDQLLVHSATATVDCLGISGCSPSSRFRLLEISGWIRRNCLYLFYTHK